MEVVVFGAGMVGTTVAKYLAEQEHNVTVVDHRPEVVRQVQESLDVQSILGPATDREVMRQAGVDHADLVLAVTDSDEINIVLSLIAQSQNKQTRVIARMRGQHYMENTELWRERGLDRTLVFSPEQAAVENLLDLLEVSRAFEVITFLGGAVRIAGFCLEANSPLVGHPLMKLSVLPATQTLVVAVEKAGQVVVPSGKTVLQPGDRVYVTSGMGFDHPEVRDLFGLHASRSRKVVLAGGGWMGHRIAVELVRYGIPVSIIERDRSRCQFLAESLDGVTVIHGDATDHDKLREEIAGASTFVGMTSNHEVNFLASLMAHQLKVRRIIAVMDNEAYLHMAPSMGIDAVVSPKLSAVAMILRILRTGKMIDAAPMLNGRLEAVFVEIQANTRLTSKPLKEAGLPSNWIIASVMRGDENLVPTGNLQLQPRDKALFIAPAGLLRKMDEVLVSV